MESSLVTKNIRIGAHRTSIRLEPELWCALEEISRREGVTLTSLYESIAQNQAEGAGGFTSRLRVYVFNYYIKRLQQVERSKNVTTEQLKTGHS